MERGHIYVRAGDLRWRYVERIDGDQLYLLFHHPDTDAPGVWSGTGGGQRDVCEDLSVREIPLPDGWSTPRWEADAKLERCRGVDEK